MRPPHATRGDGSKSVERRGAHPTRYTEVLVMYEVTWLDAWNRDEIGTFDQSERPTVGQALEDGAIVREVVSVDDDARTAVVVVDW